MMPAQPNEDFNKLYEDEGIFRYHEDGFTIEMSDGEQVITWKEVETIVGYKVDLLTFDTIRLDVFCDSGKDFSIREETPGWYQFVIRSKQALQGIDPSWDIDIMLPAFETNLTLVYDREQKNLEEALKKQE